MAYTTINKSSLYFNTLLYTGNGNDNRSITGVGFRPDFTWIKSRSSTDYHMVTDAVRGGNKQIKPNSTDAEDSDTNKIKSFISDGFTIGTGTVVNRSGATLASWNWKANVQGSSNTAGSINTAYTSANTTAGFSICKWTGSGSNATIGHGLGAVPKMYIVKNLSTSSTQWRVYHASLGATKFMCLDATQAVGDAASVFNDTEPTSSVFSVGTDEAANKNGDNLIAYCFAEKTGYSKFGTYTGNGEGGAGGTFIYTGFKPAFILHKSTSVAANWVLWDSKRNGYNSDNKALYPNLTSGDDGGNDPDILSNGFKHTATGDPYNATAHSYIYMAFAEAPLVGSNNVPCTAK